MNLLFSALPNWEEMQTDQGPVWVRRDRANNNVLQVSGTKNESTMPLSPAFDLQALVRETVERSGGTNQKFAGGACAMGKFVESTFALPDTAHAMMWGLSDGMSVAFAKYLCSQKPDANELKEVKQMVASIYWDGVRPVF